MSALKELLDTNPQLFHSAPGDHAGARAVAAGEQEAWRVSSYWEFIRNFDQTLLRQNNAQFLS